DDALNEILLNEPAAHIFFFVRVCIAGTSLGRTGVEHHGGAPLRLETGEDDLHPAPIGLAAGITSTFGKTVELVSVVIGFLPPILIPHGIGDYAVKSLKAIVLSKLRIFESIAELNLAFHIVDDHVHVGHGPGFSSVFLAV